MISVQNLLARHQAVASAPCRIDSGGTWDIKAMALPLEGIGPTTVNIALNIRTSVVISPFEDGWVRVSSEGFSRCEAFPMKEIPFDSVFGPFFAAISHFDFHGLDAHINSRSPVKSGLGGSSTALVALIKALSGISIELGGKGLSKRDILHLAYYIEDGVSGGNCGLQDQAAAVYGGVSQWKWQYGHRAVPVKRERLLDRQGQRELSRHVLIAYSGKSHVSSHTNRKWIKDFLSGRTRGGWIEANEIVHRLAQAIKAQDWNLSANLLQEEMTLRKQLTPEAMIPVTIELLGQAERAGCGARFAGAGAGGSFWALGELEDIRRLREMWSHTLVRIRGARILDCDVDPAGVKGGWLKAG